MLTTVYRLENDLGEGLFEEYTRKQECTQYLTQTLDPQDIFKDLGYPQEVLNLLFAQGWVFGWGTKSSYENYFKRGGMKACSDIGFNCTVYKVDLVLWLPDYQVMFHKYRLGATAAINNDTAILRLFFKKPNRKYRLK